ncbi:MAG: N-acetyltransferase [Phycisphaerales bacterium]|nr:N-acetyltransferase [Phycisphaerales bacterium]
MNIRSERVEDIDAIFAIHASSFESDEEALIVDDLRASGELICSLVAERGGVLLGHVAVSKASLVDTDLAVAAIGPIAVVKRCRRQGVGSALMEAAISWLDAHRFGLTVLLGDPTFYQRFGFNPAAPAGLRCPWTTTEAFQMRCLTEACPDMPSGDVRWSTAFNR